MIDLLVAGAGPTGLSAALAAAQAGWSVVVLDPREGVLDKACGEGLMPSAVEALGSLGVHPEGSPFHTIRYLRPGAVATGRLPAPGLGVRRTTLHASLDAAAAQAGVRREVGRVDTIDQQADRVRAGGFEARWMIAADGLRSPIRHHLGLNVPVTAPRRLGLRRHFEVREPLRTVDVHWGDAAEAYVTPVSDTRVGVAFLWQAGPPPDDARRPFDRLLLGFPDLAATLGEAVDEPMGAGPFQARSRRRVAGRVLLVGDAAGYLDPITGEGIKLGVLGARAAVGAIVADAPQRWEHAWRRLWWSYALPTGGLLALSRVGPLRRALPGLLRRMPGVMDAVVGWVAR